MVLMDSKIKRIYVPMTESGFYILFCLRQPQHGYGISRQVRQMTGGELIISAGTMYGTLSKMEKDGLIALIGKKKSASCIVSPSLAKRYWILRSGALNACIKTAGDWK